jgi:hypothetical protein
MVRGDNAGAYGFRMVVPEGQEPLPDLAGVAEDAPSVCLSWSQGVADEQAYEVGPRRFRMSTPGGGSLEVDGEAGTISAVLPEPVSAAAMVHPLATMPMSFLARWHGAATLHGGAFVHEGRAWVLSGEPMAGKSSMLAALAGDGVPILADDLVVVFDGQVASGPRCVDLRPDVADRTPGARPLGEVAGRERFRLSTAPAPARAPLAGIVVLGWADDPAGDPAPLGTRERLEILHEQDYSVRLGPPDPELVFGLLDVPMWRLSRARDWREARAASDQLLELASRG